jgi:hypothetical protein
MPIRLLLLVDIAVEEAFSSKPVNAPQIVRRTSVVGARLRCAFDRFLAQTACSWDRPRKGAQGRFEPFRKASAMTGVCAFETFERRLEST